MTVLNRSCSVRLNWLGPIEHLRDVEPILIKALWNPDESKPFCCSQAR